MSARDEAVALAKHYLVTRVPGDTTSDNYAEVESMIDSIIDAAHTSATFRGLHRILALEGTVERLQARVAELEDERTEKTRPPQPQAGESYPGSYTEWLKRQGQEGGP